MNYHFRHLGNFLTLPWLSFIIVIKFLVLSDSHKHKHFHIHCVNLVPTIWPRTAATMFCITQTTTKKAHDFPSDQAEYFVQNDVFEIHTKLMNWKMLVKLCNLQQSILCSCVGFCEFIECCVDSLQILLVVSFDELSYHQENICSKFNAFTLATALLSRQAKFYTSSVRCSYC